MILLCFLLLFNDIDGTQVESVWEEANRAYQAGDFTKASGLYEKLVQEGVHNGKLHFNLANAYMKQERLGPAILQYCKARKYLPNDPDVIANLNLVQSMRVDAIEGEDEAFMVGYDNILRSISPGAVQLLAMIFLALAGITGLGRILKPEMGKWLSYVLVISAVWGLIFTALAFMQHDRLDRRDLGVLIAEKTDVRAGPATTEAVSFTIHEGVRFRILGEAQGWYRIGLANGYNGWIPRSAGGVI